MRILVTGGAGFIGSHTVVELQQAGYDVVVLDNLCNASEKVIPRVEAITGKKVPFYKADILDREALEEIFSKEQIDAVIHFAGLKAVGESVQKPWEYYENNIAGTLTLVDVMRKHNVKNIIFSSSATVYGDPAMIPITSGALDFFFGFCGGALCAAGCSGGGGKPSARVVCGCAGSGCVSFAPHSVQNFAVSSILLPQ